MRRFLCLALFLLPAIAGASECRFTTERNLDIDANGLRTVAFDLGSSDVVVEGAPGLSRIEVRGRACASDQGWLDQLTVEQRRSGDRVEITPHEGRHSMNWFGSSYAYIDLHVRVPSSLAVAIDSQSGDADVSNVAALDFNASSGDLEVHHVTGAVGVKVSSGDVRGDDLGSADIRATSSGDIVLRDVHGDVEVGHSGSGDLAFRRVGAVHIGRVGSGDVSVDDAAGDVSLDSIGSGDVHADGVGGNLRVGSKGSGDIRYGNVHGTVSVPHDDD